VVEKKFSCCLETIERIGAFGIPIVTTMNKIDLLRGEEAQQRLESLKEKANNLVPISALYGTNLDLLKQRILKILKNYIRASFSVPITNESMSFISWLFNRSDVKTIRYTKDSAHVVFEAIPWFAETVKNKVQEFNGKFTKVQAIKA